MEQNPYQSPHAEPERNKESSTSAGETFWLGVTVLSTLLLAWIVSILTGANRRLLFVIFMLIAGLAGILWQRFRRHA